MELFERVLSFVLPIILYGGLAGMAVFGGFAVAFGMVSVIKKIASNPSELIHRFLRYAVTGFIFALVLFVLGICTLFWGVNTYGIDKY
ncbi:MAG: hypothetical protein AAGH99_02600 [Planctomycetota bacterium]